MTFIKITKIYAVKNEIYPAITVSKTPTSSGKMRTNQLGGLSTDRKSPIGSTNNQWDEEKPH
ncbi:hypothetical protein H131_20782 [Lysinibacillus sphaericus OT4b.31]|uniref:Uncharacterized protein n=1 Tax=Lysinibacillus sphaericus OT4b.31 TaxID=1285586 RepID=R7Z911_LYSSH|nr:hypothetical protein H131_20782 [Lysinibacillus sphaericus OT4b.31]